MGIIIGKGNVGDEILAGVPDAPPEIDPLLWAPILRGLCTLHETETVYSLDDIITMNIALEYKDETTRFYQAEADRKAKRNTK